MKKIEITTAQKVVIQYELASLRDRILAFIVDAAILWIGVAILFGILNAIIYGSSGNDEFSLSISYLILAPVVIFYTLASELITNGKTIGKHALGLKVVKLNGGVATADDFMIRWVFRAFDIYTSLGALAALLVSSSDKAQRLGGLLSNTAVIKLKGDFSIQLSDLEKMFHSSDNYEATYPEVAQYSDQQMLAIKELMKRYRSSPNEAHRKLLFSTAKKLSQQLNLKTVPANKLAFLQSVLKDYVMLTR